MEIVVRTPHGEADISIDRHAPDTTLGDLIAAVTGQAAPAVALVDGLTTACATPLDAAGLLPGSSIDTHAPAPGSTIDSEIELAQIAGFGAGRTVALTPGRHRVGPGRRARADELSHGPVEEVALELEVGVGLDVSVAPGEGPPPILDGAPVDSSTVWPVDGIVVVDGRAFVIRPRSTDRRRLLVADGDGTVPLHRLPRRSATTRRHPAVDAVRDATGPAPALWGRRLDHPDALTVAVGVRAPTGTYHEPFVIDLARHSTVALAGPERQRNALSRAILVDAATIHGPADLGVVIVTTTRRAGEWDWAKWLPHLRRSGAPMILTDDDAVEAWLHDAAARAASRTTLVVVDDADAWRRPSSPLRPVVAAPPSTFRIVALCDDPEQMPERTSLLLTESAHRRWQVTSFGDDHQQDDLLPALVETAVAADAARSLAPYRDPEQPVEVAVEPERRTLGSVVTNDDLPVGGLLDDLADGPAVVVVGPDSDDTARTAVALALRACRSHPPSSLLLLDLLRSPWTAGLADLPHYVAVDTDMSAIEPDRLIRRVEHHRGTARILTLVAGETPLGEALLAASGSVDGLTTIATASATPTTGPHVVVTVRRADSRVVIDTADLQAFALLDDEILGDLVVRPAVVGRPFTTLERQLERSMRPDPSAFAEECRRLAAAYPRTAKDHHPSLIPLPMPAAVDTESLLRDHPGDGVPVGVLDDDGADLVPLWWEPHGGSLVAVGAPHSGVDEVLNTVLVGLGDRFGVHDVELLAVDRSSSRRRAVGVLPMCVLTVTPADNEALAALVEHLELPRRTDEPPRVVSIDDLGFLRRRAADVGLGGRLDAALSAPRTVFVATARQVDDLGPLRDARVTVLIGSTGDVDAVTTDPRCRCRRQSDGALVQLAALEHPLRSSLEARTGADGGRS